MSYGSIRLLEKFADDPLPPIDDFMQAGPLARMQYELRNIMATLRRCHLSGSLPPLLATRVTQKLDAMNRLQSDVTRLGLDRLPFSHAVERPVRAPDPVEALLKDCSPLSIRNVLLSLTQGNEACAKVILDNLEALASLFWDTISTPLDLPLHDLRSFETVYAIYSALEHEKSSREKMRFFNGIQFPERSLHHFLDKCNQEERTLVLKIWFALSPEERTLLKMFFQNPISLHLKQDVLTILHNPLYLDILRLIYSMNCENNQQFYTVLCRIPQDKKEQLLQLASPFYIKAISHVDLQLWQSPHLSLEEKYMSSSTLTSLSLSGIDRDRLCSFIAKGYPLTKDLANSFKMVPGTIRSLVIENLHCLAKPEELYIFLSYLHPLHALSGSAQETAIISVFLLQWEASPEFAYAARLLKERWTRLPESTYTKFVWLSEITKLQNPTRDHILELHKSKITNDRDVLPSALLGMMST